MEYNALNDAMQLAKVIGVDPSDINIIKIYLEGAYFIGKMHGIWAVKPNLPQDCITVTQNEG